MLDAGSGIVGVNPSLLSKEPRPVSLILTHYHWDHLLGLPFFATLYQPGWDLTIHTPTLESHDPTWLDTIFKSPFFPVPYEHLPEQAEGADGRRRGSCGARVRDQRPAAQSSGRLPRLPGQGGDRRFRLRDRSRVRESRRSTSRSPSSRKGRRRSCSTRTSRPTSCRSTAAGATATGASARSSRRANGIRGLWLFHHKPGRSDQALAEIRDEAQKVFAATDTASEETFIDL